MSIIRNLSALLFLALPTLGHAQISDLSCDDSVRMTQRLVEVLGATRQSSGLRDPETILEIWVLPRNSEWLILQSYANGTSCIVAMGEHWETAVIGPA
ncbi:hypothetical protein [Yoonia sp. SS1-5]|uniref:Uncharacterized protein n=1 Tax=Yoonia rhodophyticola TaxID=3137370 RepID=A0AAN0MER7_9RHOB